MDTVSILGTVILRTHDLVDDYLVNHEYIKRLYRRYSLRRDQYSLSDSRDQL